MYYFVEIACVITEMWMVHVFLSSFFSKRSKSAAAPFLVYAICGTVTTILSFVASAVYLRLAFAVASVLFASLVLFKARPFPGLISGIAFCAIYVATDVLFAMVFQVFGVQTELLMANGTYRAFYMVTCHVIMFGLILVVCLINRNPEKHISIKILLPAVPCWFMCLLLCCLLTWQCFSMGYELHPLFILVLLGLLYTSIIVIYDTSRLTEQAQQKKDWEIAQHHYAMQQEYYDQLRIQQEETRALWHDISKYLRASQAESCDGALSQVQEMLDSIPCVVDVSNRVVSIILNEYVQSAREAQVELELDIQVPEELFVTAADLYVLIGNTMDNAIEACQALSQQERRIVLSLKTHNSILFYEISNPFSAEFHRRARNLYHGYGLKNVERCVEKYQGKMEVLKDDGVFRVTAYLNSV